MRARARALQPWNQELQWAAIALLGLVALTLGYIGFNSLLEAQGEPAGWWEVLYRDLQLFVLEYGPLGRDAPWELDVARFMVPAVTLVAALKAVTLVFKDQLALVRSRLAPDHVIVCGLGRRGLLLSRSVLERGSRVVVVEVDEDNDRIRASQRAGAPVLIGDATDPDVLRRAGIGRASHLIAVCREDGTNASVATTARGLARERRRSRSLACAIHIFDPALCDFLRTEQIAAAEAIPFRLDVFNMFEDGARALLLDHPFTVEGVPERPHVIVVGLGWLGLPLVAEIARAWREDGLARSGRLPVTLVDPEAEERERSLVLRHPWIADACELKPSKMAVGGSEFEAGDFLTGFPSGNGVVAYVCLDDTALGLAAALVLRDRVGERARIVVRTETQEGLGSLLDRRTAGEPGPGIFPFPLLDRVCDADFVMGFAYTERVARAMHAHFAEHRSREGRSDASTSGWDELEESLRESNRDAARDVGRKLRTIGCEAHPLRGEGAADFAFTPAEVELLARMEHERWVADLQRNDWTPGKCRDPVGKTTPYLVAFDELPAGVQDYDREAVTDLPDILARVGYRIVRVRSAAPGERLRASTAG